MQELGNEACRRGIVTAQFILAEKLTSNRKPDHSFTLLVHSMDGPSSWSAAWKNLRKLVCPLRVERSAVTHLGSGGTQFTSPSLRSLLELPVRQGSLLGHG